MAAKLDSLANVAVIVLCLVATATLVVRYVDARRGPAPRTPPTTYAIGEAVDDLPGVDFKKSSNTILLFVRSTCHFCTESMPFYQKLVEAVHARQGKIRVAAVSSEPSQITEAYLKAHQVVVDDIYVVPPVQGKLSATPTLLLIDDRRRVKWSYVGKLSPDKEDDILKAIAASS